MSLLSFCTNEKNVLQREIKNWAFEFYLLTGEPRQSMISADWIIEHGLWQILCVVLEFLIFFPNGEVWDCLWQAKVLSRHSEITYLPKVSKNKQVGSNLIYSKSAIAQNDHQFWNARCQHNEQFQNPLYHPSWRS